MHAYSRCCSDATFVYLKQADVAAGYFTVKRWVPRDQQHLTAGLHGGLTDPAEIAAAKVCNITRRKSSERERDQQE